MFKVVKQLGNPDNTYIIVPVEGGKEQSVNHHELKDLGDIAVVTMCIRNTILN